MASLQPISPAPGGVWFPSHVCLRTSPCSAPLLVGTGCKSTPAFCVHRCHNCTSPQPTIPLKRFPPQTERLPPTQPRLSGCTQFSSKNLPCPHPSTINHLVCPIALQFLHLSRAPRLLGFPWWLSGKESACQRRRCGFNPRVRKIPRRMVWQPPPVFFPWTEEPGRLQSVGLQKSHTTEQLNNNHQGYLLGSRH